MDFNRYTYTPDNQLSMAYAWDAVLQFEYDGNGDLKRIDRHRLGEQALTQTLSFTRENGHINSMQYPSGLVVNHTRNNGRLTSISINSKPFISDIKLNASDEPIQYTLKPTAGAKNTDRTWFAPRRADGSWAGVTLDDAANLYSYDALSQITGITPTTSNASLVPYAFEYDADGRLKQSTLKPGETREAKATYAYDANGNRTQEKLEGTGGSQTTDTWMQDGTNRLSTHSQYGAYLYDNAGNNLYAKTLFGPMNHRYDAKKRLIETTIGAVKITHTYDALGQRISRTETVEGQTPKTTLYFYDDNGLLLGEYDDKGQPIQETIYLNNRPVAVVKQGQIYTIWADHLGTTLRPSFKPFGRIT